MIPKKTLPKGIKKFIKSQKKMDGVVTLNYAHIVSAKIKDGIITRCRYYEDGQKLEWFSNHGLLFIFVDDLNIAYYKNNKLIYM